LHQFAQRIDPAMAAYLGIHPEDLGDRRLDHHNYTYNYTDIPFAYRGWASDTKIDAITATGGDCYFWVLVYNANYLEYWGDCEGLEPDLNATTCAFAPNANPAVPIDACSLSIFTGTDCYNDEVQGVPFQTGLISPYNNIKYKTNNRGYSYPWSGFHGNITNIGNATIDGLPFISK
jgi:hypothetical protein